MPSRSSPTVRRRRLAAEMRRLRKESGKTREQVAQFVGCSPVTVTRIESGQSAPRVADAARMLELYGVTGTRRDMLITLAREARRRGWWQQYSVTPWFEVYVGLEEEACEIRSYEAEAIPGLLQTEGYARAVMLADVDVPADEEIQRRIAVRMKRQERLTGDDAPRMWVVLNEAALHRQVGGTGNHARAAAAPGGGVPAQPGRCPGADLRGGRASGDGRLVCHPAVPRTR